MIWNQQTQFDINHIGHMTHLHWFFGMTYIQVIGIVGDLMDLKFGNVDIIDMIHLKSIFVLHHMMVKCKFWNLSWQ